MTPADPTDPPLTPLTLVAEGAKVAGETLAVAADVVAGAVAVDALRTRLAATLAEETWQARCTCTHAHKESEREREIERERRS